MVYKYHLSYCEQLVYSMLFLNDQFHIIHAVTHLHAFRVNFDFQNRYSRSYPSSQLLNCFLSIHLCHRDVTIDTELNRKQCFIIIISSTILKHAIFHKSCISYTIGTLLRQAMHMAVKQVIEHLSLTVCKQLITTFGAACCINEIINSPSVNADCILQVSS